MITFRVHGSIELRAADGRSLLSVLSQPKRTSLLAYLILSDPGGFQRRDTLLAIFWPDFDEQRARNSLSQALHYLRRSLGPGVIEARGDGEVGIGSGMVWCDALAFDDAIRGGRLEEALEYYRGEVLPGLNIDGAPEFERWLDQVRAQRRQVAAGAAWRLAEGAEASGDLSTALGWARRGYELQADDESALRRLLQYHDRAGDLAGALKLYDAFARRLADEFEASPAQRTLDLIDEMRSRVTLPSRTERRGPPAPEPASEPGGQRPPSGEGREGRGSRWRWQVPGAIIAGVLILVLGSALLVDRWGESRGVRVVESGRSVVIFPFDVQGAPDLIYLGRGMTDLLSAKLDGTSGLRSVDPRAVLALVGSDRVSPPDLRQARVIAEDLGADHFVLGTMIAYAGRVQLSASLYARGVSAPISRSVVDGGSGDLLELIDRLAAELLADQYRGAGHELVQLAASTTSSLPALKSYLLGEEALRDGRYHLAAEHFRAAAAQDTTFALAYYRLGVASVWSGEGSRLPAWSVDRAIAHGDRLSERGRGLLAAFRAFIARDAVEAERLYRAILASHPDDVEAWYQLGEVLFHYRPLLGWSVEESAGAFERVLSFEPGHGESLIHLARIAARRRDQVGLDSLVERLITGSPSRDRLLELRALQASVSRDPGQWAGILASAPQLSETALVTLLFSSAAHGGDLRSALELAKLLSQPNRAPRYRALGYGMAAQIEYARGSWSRAQLELAGLTRLEPASALIIASIFAVSPHSLISLEEVTALRERIVMLEPQASVETVGFSPVFQPFVQHYLAGLLSARLGDRASSLAHARSLERLGGIDSDPGLGPGLARSITASLAWNSGEIAELLSELSGAPFGPQYLKAALGYSAQGFERYLFGEALAAGGDDDGALRWFDSFPEPAGYDLIYLAPAHLRRAEIYERRGDWQAAIHHYSEFLELWADADPELEEIVMAAKDRLEALAN